MMSRSPVGCSGQPPSGTAPHPSSRASSSTCCTATSASTPTSPRLNRSTPSPWFLSSRSRTVPASWISSSSSSSVVIRPLPPRPTSSRSTRRPSASTSRCSPWRVTRSWTSGRRSWRTGAGSGRWHPSSRVFAPRTPRSVHGSGRSGTAPRGASGARSPTSTNAGSCRSRVKRTPATPGSSPTTSATCSRDTNPTRPASSHSRPCSRARPASPTTSRGSWRRCRSMRWGCSSTPASGPGSEVSTGRVRPRSSPRDLRGVSGVEPTSRPSTTSPRGGTARGRARRLWHPATEGVTTTGADATRSRRPEQRKLQSVACGGPGTGGS